MQTKQITVRITFNLGNYSNRIIEHVADLEHYDDPSEWTRILIERIERIAKENEVTEIEHEIKQLNQSYSELLAERNQLIKEVRELRDVAVELSQSDVTVRARKIMRDHPELIDHLVNEHLKHERNPDVDGIISRFNKPA